jgi:hypothetical protein
MKEIENIYFSTSTTWFCKKCPGRITAIFITEREELGAQV